EDQHSYAHDYRSIRCRPAWSSRILQTAYEVWIRLCKETALSDHRALGSPRNTHSSTGGRRPHVWRGESRRLEPVAQGLVRLDSQERSKASLSEETGRVLRHWSRGVEICGKFRGNVSQERSPLPVLGFYNIVRRLQCRHDAYSEAWQLFSRRVRLRPLGRSYVGG